MKNGQHASASAEWWTPPEIVDPARGLVEGFELDPASCPLANGVIRAARIFTAEYDGLRQSWNARAVWCNPPSKKGENAAWEWWVHGAREWQRGHVGTLFFMVFNPSSFFQVAQAHALIAKVPTPQQAVRVEFLRRVRYLRATESLPLPGVDGAEYERGDAPPHGSALLMLTDTIAMASRFVAAYAHLGECVLPGLLPSRTA